MRKDNAYGINDIDNGFAIWFFVINLYTRRRRKLGICCGRTLYEFLAPDAKFNL
jgi:hypothetical protein